MDKYILLNDVQLKKQISKKHPVDIAKLIEGATVDVQMRVISILPIGKVIEVFKQLPSSFGKYYFNFLKEKEKKQFLNAFEMNELKNFVYSFDPTFQTYIYTLLGPEKLEKLKQLLSYDETLVASLMTSEFIVIKNTNSIQEATAKVLKNAKDNVYIDDIFVVDEKAKFYGTVSLKDLIIARKGDSLEDIITKTKETLSLTDSLNKGYQHFRDYDKNVMAIIDENNFLVGVVMGDDIFKQIAQVHEENIEKLVAVGDYDEASSAGKRAMQRLPWLLASVVLNLVIAATLTVFQATIEQVLALVLFQPMILGMAGNIGTQSIAVTILKLNESLLEDKKETKRHVLKEVGIGFINSILVGIAGFLISYGVLSLIKIGSHNPIDVSFVIGTSLSGGMFISACFGVFIPVFLEKRKIDPAAASGPIISTINDFFALATYFGIATLMFIL